MVLIKLKVALKLHASVTNETTYHLSSIRDNAWKLSYFHIISHLLRLSMKQNLNPVTLDIARIVTILFKVKLQTAFASLLKRNFPYTFFFLWIFRAAILLNKCFKKVLKECTAKLFYQELGKHRKRYQTNTCALQSVCSKKIKIGCMFGKLPYRSPDSLTLRYDLI